jgi:hypothetical protein
MFVRSDECGDAGPVLLYSPDLPLCAHNLRLRVSTWVRGYPDHMRSARFPEGSGWLQIFIGHWGEEGTRHGTGSVSLDIP